MSTITALQILECVARSPQPTGLTELQKLTAIPIATLNRHVKALVTEGYLQRIERGHYSCGASMHALAIRAMESSSTSLFEPILQQLAATTGLNAELYAITPHGPMYLLGVHGACDYRIRMPLGWAVQYPPSPASIFFALRYPGRKQWDNEIDPDNRWIAAAQERGYAMDRGEVRPELARIGIAAQGGNYCLCLSGLLSDIPPSREKHFFTLLQQESLELK